MKRKYCEINKSHKAETWANVRKCYRGAEFVIFLNRNLFRANLGPFRLVQFDPRPGVQFENFVFHPTQKFYK